MTLTITLSAEQMQIIEQAHNMISHCVPNKNWADVFTYLAKKEVTRRTTTRSSQAGISKAVSSKTRSSKIHSSKIRRGETHSSDTYGSDDHNSETCSSETRNTKPTGPKPKAITAATAVKNFNPQSKRTIPARDRKRLLHPTATCKHQDFQGRPCGSTRFLQIDHIQSWSQGGTHHPENLQVLCGVHNRLKYQTEILGL